MDLRIIDHAGRIGARSPRKPMIHSHHLAPAACNREARVDRAIRGGHVPSRHRLGGLLKGCAIALVTGLLLLGGVAYWGYSVYTSIKAEVPAMDGQVATWMTSYDAGDFAACYRAADEALRAESTEADFVARLAALRDQTGKVVLGARTGFFVRSVNGDTTVRRQWDGSGEHGPVAVEFTLHKTSSWKVASFQITNRP
jgi:hypothetical protein